MAAGVEGHISTSKSPTLKLLRLLEKLLFENDD